MWCPVAYAPAFHRRYLAPVRSLLDLAACAAVVVVVVLINARKFSQIRLPVHAARDCVRDCSAHLENTSASISAAGIFQVRWQESKVLEQGAYRKSGG